MQIKSALSVAALATALCAMAPLAAQEKQKPVIKIPESGQKQIMTIEGNFVRAAYNNEGYVILGYKTANMSLGDEWLLLDVGMTVRDDIKAYQLKRENLSLVLPDESRQPLPTVEEYRNADLRALNQRANVARDSINYFPPMASQACRIGFFSDVDQRALPWDEVELSNTRACLGRIFFKVPGGIKYGQYWLDVQFRDSLVRVPFRILTKEEEKTLSKNYKDIRKQVQEAFKPPKKK
jgi:hypothetical protein